MQHLAIERLAELADGEPTAAEKEHLTECAMCAAEREAYRRVVSIAADERRRIAPPISTWGLLSEELREQRASAPQNVAIPWECFCHALPDEFGSGSVGFG